MGKGEALFGESSVGDEKKGKGGSFSLLNGTIEEEVEETPKRGENDEKEWERWELFW